MADHVFAPGGDACPICIGLEGEPVPEGFNAHDNCACQTIPADEDEECEWSFQQSGNARDGSGEFDVITGIEVTVTCWDGSEIGMSGEFDGHPYTPRDGATEEEGWNAWDAWVEGLEEAASEIASELCSQCPERPPVA